MFIFSVKDIFRSTVFNYFAGIHNGNLITSLRHYAKVVGYQNHRCINLIFKFIHHFKNLCLYRNIQCSSRLISKQQFGFARKRNGYHDALLHSSRKLVWVIVLPTCGDTHHFKYIVYSRLNIGMAYTRTMQIKHLSYLVPNRNCWIQARHRILKYHGYCTATKQAHICFRCRQHICSLKSYAALYNFAYLIR